MVTSRLCKAEPLIIISFIGSLYKIIYSLNRLINSLHSRQYSPFGSFKNCKCIPITELRRTQDVPTFTSNENIEEHILNFHFAPSDDSWKSTVNGILNILPSTPLQVRYRLKLIEFE